MSSRAIGPDAALTRDVPGGPRSHWLRDARFDALFVAGTATLALALGGVASLSPTLFAWVIVADFWLLAYPHVASTYTRIAFDRASVRRHRALLFALPPVVFGATASLALLGGVAALNSVYFYWQTWHYSRQSYGIARAYDRNARGSDAPPDPLTALVLFAFPAWGLLARSFERQAWFYGSPLYTVAVPRAAVLLAGAVAFVALGCWLARQIRAFDRGGAASLGLTFYVLSHVVITVVSYLVVRDITRGWVVVNVWHNAQYLLFVWAFNERRFRGGIEPERAFLSTISQRRNVAWYALVCLAIAAAFYLALGRLSAGVTLGALPLVLLCHQAVNFHHYVVDAVIWRRPRASAA